MKGAGGLGGVGFSVRVARSVFLSCLSVSALRLCGVRVAEKEEPVMSELYT